MKVRQALTISKLVDKLDLTIENPKGTANEIGASLIMQMVAKAHQAEDEVSELISQLTGCPKEEALDQDLESLFDKYKDEGIVSFFTSRLKQDIQESSSS